MPAAASGRCRRLSRGSGHRQRDGGLRRRHQAEPELSSRSGTGSDGTRGIGAGIYDPAKISYERLLDIYWHHIDPLTVNAAFCDHGPQYRSIIFYADTAQRRAAEASKKALDESHRFPTPIVTAIEPATPFYPAEDYHQQYYKKNPVRYQAYRIGCGRDARMKQLWGDIAMNKESAK